MTPALAPLKALPPPARLTAMLAVTVMSLFALSMFIGRGLDAFHPAWWRMLLQEPALARTIFLDIRLPRAVLALLVGAALGLAGAVLQGLLRNPLADPGLIGTSSGAALGAVIVFYFGFGGVLALPFGGLVGALIALLLVIAIAGWSASTLTIILAGIAVSGLGGALTALALNFAPSPFAAFEFLTWSLGSVTDRSWSHVWISSPFMLAGMVALLSLRRALDALTLGDETALSLGIDVSRARLFAIVGTALAVGAAASVAGVIGFVGLVAPHLVRAVYRHQPGRILVPSMLAGAALLLAADIVVRLVTIGPELKLGVVTALVGAPFFLALIARSRREGW